MSEREELTSLVEDRFDLHGRRYADDEAVFALVNVAIGILEAQGRGGGFGEPSPGKKLLYLADTLVQGHEGKLLDLSPHVFRSRLTQSRRLMSGDLGGALENAQLQSPDGEDRVVEALARLSLGLWDPDSEHFLRSLTSGRIAGYFVDGYRLA